MREKPGLLSVQIAPDTKVNITVRGARERTVWVSIIARKIKAAKQMEITMTTTTTKFVLGDTLWDEKPSR